MEKPFSVGESAKVGLFPTELDDQTEARIYSGT